MLILSALGLAGCAGAGAALGGLALEAGRKFLLNTADSNFDPQYNASFEKMLDVLLAQAGGAPASERSRTSATAGTVTPGIAPAPQSFRGVEELVPIELEVTVVREVVVDGSPIPVPVEDGATLRDGVGRESDGDNLKIRFRTNTDCYVYAVWVDATAWSTPIFPRSTDWSYENPVEADREYSLPEGGDWLYLDDYRGVERLYFVASHDPIPELEDTLESFIGMTRSFRTEGQEVALLDEPGEITRGLAGTRPGRASAVQATDGTTHEVASQAFIAALADSDLVVTRWFRHE